jgi:hypothetical protein
MPAFPDGSFYQGLKYPALLVAILLDKQLR